MRHAPRLSYPRTLLGLAVAGLLAVTMIPGMPDHARAEPDENASVRARVMHKLHRMTVEEKVGQLFMPHVYGKTATTQDPWAVAKNQQVYGVDNAAQLIEKYHLGAVIYYTWTRNLQNPTQIAKLSNGIQRAAMRQRPRIPMLIGIDQEQGIVTRIGHPATTFPGNMALGASRSTEDAYTAAKITGRELKAMGISQNFAPVADVNVNPANPVIGVRSFGSDPQMVARLTGAAVDGYQDSGISAAAKHFPGHGDTSKDTHDELAKIDHSIQEWRRIDLPPFQAAISRDAGMIMTGHLLFPAVDDSGRPSTLSKRVLTGLLRESLGYDGVVVTDAMDMGAIVNQFGAADSAVMAIKAGADLLDKPPEGKLDEQYNAVLEAVRSGEISKQRLNEAVTHLLRLKFRLGLFRDPYVDPEKTAERVGTPESYETAREITDRTTTLVKNEGDILPLERDSGKDVLVTGWGSSTTTTLTDKITARGVNADRMYTGSQPSDKEISGAVAAAKSHDVTVVVTGGAWEDKGQQKLVRELTATGKPVIAIAATEPYDIAYFPEVPAFLATYSATEVSVGSATRVLFGEVNPSGKLPVMIPTAQNSDEVLYPYGHGLTYG